MKITSLLTLLCLTIINAHSAQADTLVGYNVIQTYSDGTTFSGSFAFNYTKQTITNLSGTLYDNAMKAPPLPLTYQLSPSTSDGNGGLLASVYLLNTTTVFAPGSTTMTAGNGNAFVTIDVNATNPLLGATSLNGLAYADCSSGGIMGKMCTTGVAGGGTMKGVPTGETILSAAGLYDGIWMTSAPNPQYFSIHQNIATGQLIIIDVDPAGGPTEAYSGILSANTVQLSTIFTPNGCYATATATFQNPITLSYTFTSGNCATTPVGVPNTATKIF